MEQYARIEEYPNYAVSNFGNILNIKTGLFLKGNLESNGYYQVQLWNGTGGGSKPKNYLIHRLVGRYFIDNPNMLEMIDHIDRNKLNNNVSNLRRVSRSQNNRNRENRGCIVKDKKCNSWKVQIGTRGSYYTKRFNSLEEAQTHLQQKILDFDTDILNIMLL